MLRSDMVAVECLTPAERDAWVAERGAGPRARLAYGETFGKAYMKRADNMRARAIENRFHRLMFVRCARCDSEIDRLRIGRDILRDEHGWIWLAQVAKAWHPHASMAYRCPKGHCHALTLGELVDRLTTADGVQIWLGTHDKAD